MIGVFDGGLGGLSVLGEIQCQLPEHDLLYLGDTAGGPYDAKSPELVAARLAEGLSRLVDAGAGMLVVADHGAAACLTAEIGNRFSLPILNILSHGVLPAVAPLSPKSIGIMGPPIVEAAGAHRDAIQKVLPDTRIFSAAAPLLTHLVEAGWLKKPETVMIVKKYLHFFKMRQVAALVPAGNHYLHLVPILQRKMGKRVAVINAAASLAGSVKAYLSDHPEADARCKKGGGLRAAVTDLTDGMEKAARFYYGKNIRLEQA